MPTYSVHQAKTHLSRILKILDMNDEVIISCNGKPIARLIPYAPQVTKRQPGRLKNKFKIDDSFFDPLPEAELSAWND